MVWTRLRYCPYGLIGKYGLRHCGRNEHMGATIMGLLLQDLLSGIENNGGCPFLLDMMRRIGFRRSIEIRLVLGCILSTIDHSFISLQPPLLIYLRYSFVALPFGTHAAE